MATSTAVLLCRGMWSGASMTRILFCISKGWVFMKGGVSLGGCLGWQPTFSTMGVSAWRRDISPACVTLVNLCLSAYYIMPKYTCEKNMTPIGV